MKKIWCVKYNVREKDSKTIYWPEYDEVVADNREEAL